MEKCRYCRRSKTACEKSIVHASGCPQVIPAYAELYEQGWADAYIINHDEIPKPDSDHIAYMMGFRNGRLREYEERMNAPLEE